MAPSRVRVNPLFYENRGWYIDLISKCFVGTESLTGLNRLSLVVKDTRYFYVVSLLGFMYSLALSSWIIYTCYDLCATNAFDSWFIFIMLALEYMFCVVFNFVSWKRMERYYNEMNKFDIEVGCRPKTSRDSLRHSIYLVGFTAFTVVFYVLLNSPILAPKVFIPLLLIYLTHGIEIFYYGHLLSLLVPRLRLINYYMESTLSHSEQVKRPTVDKFLSFKHKNIENCEMDKVMDNYNIITTAYDYLMEAIKWQLLVILITTFVCTLSFCYDLSQHIMSSRTNSPAHIVSDIGLMIIEMIPLFSPCVFGDRVHNEVRRLRELIASRLYENKLDKAGRSTARALLALTEARDLSFSLLHMLQIDIALPFKFIGLLFTYLIILVQFDKVIHPTKPVVN